MLVHLQSSFLCDDYQEQTKSFKSACKTTIVKSAHSDEYPVIAQGYGVFITPDSGCIFPYEEHNGVKRALSSCDNLNVQACAILEQCTGSHTVRDICSILERTFEDTPPDLCAQVESLLDDAYQKGYITYYETPVDMEGLLQGSRDYYTPSQVLLETTARCNLRCGHCLLSAGKPLENELTAQEFIPILERFHEIGVKHVTLSGGEVLTKKDWEILADFCVCRFSCGVLTNGTVITEEIADRMSYLKDVQVSLYGADAETHEKIAQVKGSFERALTGIRLLTERGVTVGVSALMVPFNLNQLEDIVNLAISAKCRIVRVGIVCPIGRARHKEWELTADHMAWLDTEMRRLRQEHKDEIDIRWEEDLTREEHRCGAGFTTWTVVSNGDVYPCGSWRIPLGNLTKDDPVDILNSPLVKFLQEVKTPHDKMCGACQYLYVCQECHGHAHARYSRVEECGWAKQFGNAPGVLKIK